MPVSAAATAAPVGAGTGEGAHSEGQQHAAVEPV